MTNDFKPTLPFIPKTETRIFLGGRPIEQVSQTGKQSLSGQNKQHYQSERANEINPSYGPGFEDDLKEIGKGLGKFVGSVALATTTVVCPPVGMAATAVVGIGGAVATHVGRENGDKKLEEAGMTALSIAGGSVKGPTSDTGKLAAAL
ncbi:MAG: hypothetical protein MRECE_2c094 [Mycoplasmataceae bacterium CE_OT135]|nr:MAG: hypothetical protein MRECE_2c094 [Mycoplasmataceae bacterium CE_OT135]